MRKAYYARHNTHICCLSPFWYEIYQKNNIIVGDFMLIARVVGSAVATIKDERLNGTKLLVVREANARGEPTGKPLVAIDTVDAGVGDVVLIASGSSARQTSITKDRPVDAVIMALLDSLEVDGETTFRKS